jgi:hypothetical protein
MRFLEASIASIVIEQLFVRLARDVHKSYVRAQRGT